MKNIKTQPILLFLKSKSWSVEKKTNRYHVLIPPSMLPFEKGARFYVPLEKYEGTEGYMDSISGLLESISFLYGIDMLELELLFSKSLESLRSDASQLQSMLAQAS